MDAKSLGTAVRDQAIVSRRAVRRAAKERKRRYAAKIVLEVWREKHPAVLENMVHNADNLKICNGPCCKNPRRSGWLRARGKTRKELMKYDD